MDILKSLGLKDKDTPKQEEKQDQNKPDPHAHGGCCGSCGGHKKESEQR